MNRQEIKAFCLKFHWSDRKHYPMAPKFDTYRKNSSISSSEKPTASSLSLRSFFSSSLALRARLVPAIVSIEVTKRPGFCVYKAKIVIPIPKVTPSKNVSRTVDFIAVPSSPHNLVSCCPPTTNCGILSVGWASPTGTP